MNRIVTTSIIALAGAALAGAASAAEILYKDGAWTWEDGSWEGGVKPGVEDTAVIPELPTLKNRFKDGKMQSNGLMADEEIGTLRFSDLYGISVQANQYSLTLGRIVCDDMHPTGDDLVQVATNFVKYCPVIFKNETNEVYVGTNHVFAFEPNVVTRRAGSVLLKTGPGTLCHNSQFSWSDDPASIWVQEGTYLRSNSGSPSFKGDMTVGGAGKTAGVVIAANANANTFSGRPELKILPGGSFVFDGKAAALSLVRLTVDHGLLDGGGGECFQASSAQEGETVRFTLCGAVVRNMRLGLWAGDLKVLPAAETSALYGTLAFNAKGVMDVEDGPAFVDFLVEGDFEGVNRELEKRGAGTMLVRVGDHVNMWGGTAGRSFNIYGGGFYFESSETEGVGMGTNDIVVAAGATYGAVGRHVGAAFPNRKRYGNVILTNATFAVGRLDPGSGALKPGSYTVGTEEEPGDVTFTDLGGTLRLAADKTGFSRLAVNGTLALGGAVALDVVGPADVMTLPTGTYEVVYSREPIAGSFATLTYNGAPMPSYLHPQVTEHSVVLRVPVKGMAVIVR